MDTRIDMLNMVILGLVAVFTILGGFYLAAHDKELPGELIAFGAAAVGALSQRLPGVRRVTITNPGETP